MSQRTQPNGKCRVATPVPVQSPAWLYPIMTSLQFVILLFKDVIEFVSGINIMGIKNFQQ